MDHESAYTIEDGQIKCPYCEAIDKEWWEMYKDDVEDIVHKCYRCDKVFNLSIERKAEFTAETFEYLILNCEDMVAHFTEEKNDKMIAFCEKELNKVKERHAAALKKFENEG